MAVGQPENPACVRVEDFVIDPHTQEITKRGIRVKTGRQAVQVLLMLLRRPGKLVTREEIRQELWPAETVVEFEHSINIAVSRLRSILGRGPGGQPYIDTVRGQGYRFMGAVQWEREVHREPVPEIRMAIEEPVARVPPPRSKPAMRTWWLIAAGVTGLLLLAVTFTHFGVSNPPPALKLQSLVNYSGESDKVSFSPDGKFIAFLWRQEGSTSLDVYVRPVQSGEPLQITSDPVDKAGPVWSPDGLRIAFARAAPDHRIYIVPVLGGPESKVPGVSVTEPDLSWSRDGRHMAFVDEVAESKVDGIWVADLETGKRKRLTEPRNSIGDRSPVFSPDGQYIAFVRIALVPRVTDLYIVSARGGEA